ncbi:MAG TPA: hypothetical protein VLC46_08105 [Thermoanaerobaculia bacterium]|jgi:hypothetical protein|nr:hypothetical protein [Thermoanaerobaculia bacterium]
MPTVKSVTVAVAMLLLSGACQRSEDRYLKRNVAREEIVGSWQMTLQSVKDLRDLGYLPSLTPNQHTITLRPDGTCHFATLLDGTTADNRPGPSLNCECRWRIGTVGHQALLLDLDIDAPKFRYYYFGTDDAGKLVLWQYATDPDAWRYVEYERRPRQAPLRGVQ